MAQAKREQDAQIQRHMSSYVDSKEIPRPTSRKKTKSPASPSLHRYPHRERFSPECRASLAPEMKIPSRARAKLPTWGCGRSSTSHSRWWSSRSAAGRPPRPCSGDREYAKSGGIAGIDESMKIGRDGRGKIEQRSFRLTAGRALRSSRRRSAGPTSRTRRARRAPAAATCSSTRSAIAATRSAGMTPRGASSRIGSRTCMRCSPSCTSGTRRADAGPLAGGAGGRRPVRPRRLWQRRLAARSEGPLRLLPRGRPGRNGREAHDPARRRGDVRDRPRRSSRRARTSSSSPPSATRSRSWPPRSTSRRSTFPSAIRFPTPTAIR